MLWVKSPFFIQANASSIFLIGFIIFLENTAPIANAPAKDKRDIVTIIL